MKRKSVFTPFLLFIVSLGCGCGAVMQNVTLGDGRTINHPYRDGLPMPATNAIARVEYAGCTIKPGKTDSRAHLLWVFKVSELGPALRSVRIRDVTETPRAVEIDTNKHDATTHSWIGMTKPLPVSEQSEPWLYQQGDTTKVFEFTIETTDGVSLQLYQPVRFPNNKKTDYVYFIAMLNEASKTKARNPDAKILMFK